MFNRDYLCCWCFLRAHEFQFACRTGTAKLVLCIWTYIRKAFSWCSLCKLFLLHTIITYILAPHIIQFFPSFFFGYLKDIFETCKPLAVTKITITARRHSAFWHKTNITCQEKNRTIFRIAYGTILAVHEKRALHLNICCLHEHFNRQTNQQRKMTKA